MTPSTRRLCGSVIMKPHAIWFTVGACFIGTGIYLHGQVTGWLVIFLIGFGLICVANGVDEFDGA